jgi:hypothetical protein
MLRSTGRREPISISGAGKVVDGILRRRPCFFLSHKEAAQDGWSLTQVWFKKYGLPG